jgi:3-hydroxymyristoyl/3-hydroxydecanoyl-(acyl carrier protein) dehydratase
LRSENSRQRARPGETIILEARVVGRLANLIQAQAAASVNGQTVLQAEMVLSGEKRT